MKKTSISAAALALALTAGSALAADLPSMKAPPYIPPPPPPMWTGFYVGLNAGYTWANSNTVTFTNVPLFRATNLSAFGVAAANTIIASGNGTFGSNHDGFIGGGQIGYNWQFMNNFLVGVEADIQGIAGGGRNTSAVTVFPVASPPAPAGTRVVSTFGVSKSIDYLGTVRGRLGWLFTPTLLAYGTGGLAYGGVNLNTTLFQALVPSFGSGALVGASAFSDTRVGWTAGAGLEWMFWPNWSAKVEYLYYDLGNVTTPSGVLASRLAGAAPNGIFVASVYQARTRYDGHIVRAGVNYHFNWGAPAPVMAKY